MESIFQDVRYGIRQLRSHPGFATVAILSLALGIGANTAIFTLINAVMLRPLPVHEPQQLVILKWSARKEPTSNASYNWSGCPASLNDPSAPPSGCSFSYPMFELISSRKDLFTGVSGFAGPITNHLTASGHVDTATTELVSGDFFSMLGVGIRAGRALASADDLPGAPPVAVISYGYWQSRFGGDPSIIGKSILLENAPVTVIGVAAQGFSGIDPGLPVDFWVPLSSQKQINPDLPARTASKSLWVEIIARLKPGVPISQAQSVTATLFASGASNGEGAIFKPGDSPQIELVSGGRLVTLSRAFSRPLFVLMAAVALTLLIACANVGGLALARATTREREIATRVSLGASQSRIVRQLLTESLLLATVGALLGILLASWGANLLANFLAASWYVPIKLNIRPDASVLLFTCVVAMLTALFCGLAPALHSRRLGLAPLIQGAGILRGASNPGRAFRFGGALVMAQVGLSIVVLAGAGLLLRTLVNLQTLHVGFDAHNVLIFSLDSTQTGYKGERSALLDRELQNRLTALPGVTSVSYSEFPLLSGASMNTAYPLPGAPDQTVPADVLPVGVRFFETMHIPLLAGRTFTAADFGGAMKPGRIIVNESLAKALFGKENPLGREFTDGSAPHVVIGVVGDIKYTNLRKGNTPTAYLPLTDEGPAEFEIRTAGDPLGLVSAVRSTANNIDANLLISDLKTQTAQIDQALYQERLVANLSSIFGGFALLLTCIGIYGLASYEVTRRTREIGIRVALGALPAEIRNLTTRRSLLLIGAGSVIGVAAGVGVTRYLQALLYGVRLVDPWIFAGAVILLALVAMLGSYIPARRAMKVDPIVALRYE